MSDQPLDPARLEELEELKAERALIGQHLAARRAGRLAHQRLVIEAQLALGEHVHVVTADPRGIECPGGQCTPEELQRAALRAGAATRSPSRALEAEGRRVIANIAAALSAPPHPAPSWDAPGVALEDLDVAWRRANPGFPHRSSLVASDGPAHPIPVRGLVGRLEAAAARRGWTRVARILARIDERNLGK